jgi:hypothetical protein
VIRARAGAESAARGLRINLVAAGDARKAIARGEQQVEARSRHADPPLDPAAIGELALAAEGRHGGGSV